MKIFRTLLRMSAATLVCVQFVFAGRTTISLNGTWELTKGTETAIPSSFGATAPVPGLISLASGTIGSGSWAWYRKTFTLTETATQVALIKIHKAKYGTRVYLNGSLVGDHLPCWTPGYFNVRQYLNFNGANTLVVRTGPQSSLPNYVFSGNDGEKHTYNPGIYDAVELIICNSPRVVNVQTAAALDSTVKIVAEVKNESTAPYSGSVAFTVRRLDNGATAGTGQANVTVAAGASAKATATVRISGCQYWSPETPFLYELATTTDGDERRDRFGMRTFRFPAPAYWPELNGRTYMMLGTNVAPARFEDDPEHRLLWDTIWVRRLIREFKRMHWNSMRTHMQFLPDFWYDIMDQEGFMIQDEFPCWGWAYNNNMIGSGKTVAELILEGREWLFERCNHPSLFCWDIANETGYYTNDGDQLTGPAVDSLRTYDIQNLPWDNSYGSRRKDGDICEVHPYIFSEAPGTLLKLSIVSDDPLKVGAQTHQFQPAVNNEFEWIWLNRNSSATTLSQGFYNAMAGYRIYGDPAKATGQDRRHVYDLHTSALIEFWRVGKKCRIIHHFSGLASSVPGTSATCDFWLSPLADLKMSDEFNRYVRSASAPVCVCVKKYDDEYVAATAQSVPVKIANDTRAAWTKNVILKIRKAGDTAALVSSTKSYSVNALDTLTQAFSITMPSQPGKYQLVAEYADGSETVQSMREFDLTYDIPLSYWKTAVASSENSSNKAPAAVDHDYWTRWQANSRNSEWIYVDLGSTQQIGRIKLCWEAAYASAYSVQVSNSTTSWTTIQTVTNGAPGYREFTGLNASGRYVRVLCTTAGTSYNYSLIEFQVFGMPVVASREIPKSGFLVDQPQVRIIGNGLKLSVPCHDIISIKTFSIQGKLLSTKTFAAAPGTVLLTNPMARRLGAGTYYIAIGSKTLGDRSVRLIKTE